MCRKMKLNAALLNLLHYFYHWIKRAKTLNFVHSEALEEKHENTNFRCGSYLRGVSTLNF